MDHHIREHYHQFSDQTPLGQFHKVVLLDPKQQSWKEIEAFYPNFPRGWYELMEQQVDDRIEFCREFWLQTLPYHKKVMKAVVKFFSRLDTIVVFMTQKQADAPFIYEMVYSIQDNRGFFRGRAPLSTSDEIKLQHFFDPVIVPEDYIDFLRIHNGFCKATDSTGVLHVDDLVKAKKDLLSMVKIRGDLKTLNKNLVDPETLFPFYESFGLHSFHCFWDEWYPKQEMGVVYYSGETHTVSGRAEQEKELEKLSFSIFSDWLSFYLEDVLD